MLKKLIGLFTSPEYTLATIAVRVITGLVVAGGAVWGVEAAWTNFKSSICEVQVNNVVVAQRDATIKALQAKIATLADQNKDLEARRANDQLAVQEAEAQTDAAKARLDALKSNILVPDTHVDLVNESLDALAKGGGGKRKPGSP